MGNIEAITADQCEAVWPLSIEAGWNQNVGRLAFHAGRGPRLWLSWVGRQMGSEFPGPAVGRRTRLDQHGAGNEGAASQWCRQPSPQSLHRRSARERRRRRPRCDGARPADLPAAGLSRSVQDRALAFRRREELAVEYRASPFGAIRFARGHRLRPRAERHGPAVFVDASCRQATECRLGRGVRGTSSGIRDGTGRAGRKFDRPGRRRRRNDRPGIDRQGGCIGPRPRSSSMCPTRMPKSAAGWSSKAR